MVVWGTDAGIDAAINRCLESIFEDGEARLLRHGERASTAVRDASARAGRIHAGATRLLWNRQRKFDE